MQPKNTTPLGSEDEEENEEYTVEKIVNHRTNKKGKLEYFLKWKGFPDDQNTWEPANHLNAPSLVKEYEDERKRIGESVKDPKQPVKRKTSDGSTPNKKKRNLEKEGEIKVSVDNGFEKGWTAEEILGATETLGELYFLIKWKQSDDATLLAAKTVNVKIPQMVIAFYEARTTWDNKGKGKQKNNEADEGTKT